ncbi:MAG: flavodoxin-dependent (E)-4-hydroxy-3-methylbut-2-enyl-diphosphate synthase [Candidatus Omnitrophota bacterium]
MLARRKTITVKIGNILIGGDHPVAIQSMTKTKTSDIEETIRQIEELEGAGCEIVRLAVKNSLDASALSKIKKAVKIPLVGDIHFNWRLAIQAIDSGVDKIRLNPGNIYKKEELKGIVSALKNAKIPLRVGVNSGSVKESNSKRLTMPDRLVASALDYVKTLESLKFYDIVISLKASNVLDTVEAYEKIAKLCDYPLHLGVTATGLPYAGAIKSSIALGSLLMNGIGDTLRISLTDKPQQEVAVAKIILESLSIRRFGPQIISCPTCGRCEVDLEKIARDLELRISASGRKLYSKPLKIAIMGCVVNGPGEAKEADIGVAFGKKEGLLFKKGKPVRKISSGECVDTLIKEISKGL